MITGLEHAFSANAHICGIRAEEINKLVLRKIKPRRRQTHGYRGHLQIQITPESTYHTLIERLRWQWRTCALRTEGLPFPYMQMILVMLESWRRHD
jgi:hypothetical protein